MYSSSRHSPEERAKAVFSDLHVSLIQSVSIFEHCVCIQEKLSSLPLMGYLCSPPFPVTLPLITFLEL